MKRPSPRALVVGLLALSLAVLGSLIAYQHPAGADDGNTPTPTGNDSNSGVISTHLGV